MNIAALGSLLKYGLPGLALGLVLGIVLGIVGKKLTKLTNEALKVCFRYATVFILLVGIFNTVPLVLNYLDLQKSSRMTIAVNVEPSLGKNFPNAVAHISSELTPNPTGNLVDVSTHGAASVVSVDVTDIAKAMKSLGLANAELKTRLQRVEDEHATVYAATMTTTPAIRETIAKVIAAPDRTATANLTCRTENSALCGWAHMANGNVQAAKASFATAAADSAVPKDQAASARNGLGYAYLTEGNVSEAIMQTSKAVKAGDQGAVKQLQAIKISSEAAAH
jgi:hypothetical protein